MIPKYKENMSPAELKAFQARCAFEDECYSMAFNDETACSEEEDVEEAPQDETLRKAALNRGQP
jgi:hypothetical protein